MVVYFGLLLMYLSFCYRFSGSGTTFLGLKPKPNRPPPPPPPSTLCVNPTSSLCRKHVNFRRIAAVSLAALLDAFPECCVYDMVAPTLLELAGLDGPRSHGKEDPIMQARAVACLAAAWPRVPTTVTAAAMETEAALARREAVRNVQRAHAEELTRALSGSLQRKVWSVRVPIYHVLAAVVGRSYTLPSSTAGSGGDGQGVASSPPVLIPVLTGSLLSEVVRAVEQGAEDAKYSQVRL